MLLVRARLELHKSSVIVRLAMYDDPRAFFLSLWFFHHRNCPLLLDLSFPSETWASTLVTNTTPSSRADPPHD